MTWVYVHYKYFTLSVRGSTSQVDSRDERVDDGDTSPTDNIYGTYINHFFNYYSINVLKDLVHVIIWATLGIQKKM